VSLISIVVPSTAFGTPREVSAQHVRQSVHAYLARKQLARSRTRFQAEGIDVLSIRMAKTSLRWLRMDAQYLRSLIRCLRDPSRAKWKFWAVTHNQPFEFARFARRTVNPLRGLPAPQRRH